MKIGRVLLTAAIAALMVTSAASAAGSAWFTMLNDGGSGATVVEGPGQTLIIDKGPSASPVTLTIGFNIDTAGEPILGYALGLAPAFGTSYNVNSGALNSWGPGSASFGTPIGPEGAAMAGIDHAGSTAAAAAANGLMFQFELIIDKPYVGVTEIFGFVGNNGIAGFDGTYATPWSGSWGSNAAADGLPGNSVGGLPVIVINNIPEPATMALLGLGAVALIRRRR